MRLPAQRRGHRRAAPVPMAAEPGWKLRRGVTQLVPPLGLSPGGQKPDAGQQASGRHNGLPPAKRKRTTVPQASRVACHFAVTCHRRRNPATPRRKKTRSPGFYPAEKKHGVSFMRIAQIAPLTESVPPRLYGGTERVVAFLTEELVAMGHDVTLFASGDSVTSAKLAAMHGRRRCVSTPACATRSRRICSCWNRSVGRADEFDVLHCHLDYWPFSLFSRLAHAVPDHIARPAGSAGAEADLRLLSTTCRWCRSPMPSAGRCRTRISSRLCIMGCRRICCRHGRCRPGYLAFLGRICPEKCPDRAIRDCAARRHSAEDRREGRPRRRRIFPRRDSPDDRRQLVEHIGEIGDAEKADFLSGAGRCWCRSTGRSRSDW